LPYCLGGGSNSSQCDMAALTPFFRSHSFGADLSPTADRAPHDKSSLRL
jgi:hypothetical protein